MPDPKIQKFKLDGKSFLWSYKSKSISNRGVHFTCNDLGSQKLVELLEMMNSSKWSSDKKINLQIPSDKQRSICGSEKTVVYNQLHLKYSPKNPEDMFSVKIDHPIVQIVLGKQSLEKLKSSIEAIPQDCGDYNMGEEIPFWFWWCLKDNP